MVGESALRRVFPKLRIGGSLHVEVSIGDEQDFGID